ncbi:MAG: hypothetical protein IJ228_11275 [Succinivibrio sp.]|nr:hypothetical protein [Succinivibrio sp.]
MSDNFRLSALDAFSHAQLGDDNNAIANLAADGSLQSNGTFSKSNILRFLRSGATKEQNNAVRTELLKSLGQAFGLSGISTDKNGKITFSKDFMDKLESLLGPAFKRSDFGVSADGGAVTSGKPLTQRRITEIMTQASAYHKSDFKNFSVTEYRDKLAIITKNLDEMGIPNKADSDGRLKEGPRKIFSDVAKCLDFLENEVDEVVRLDPAFELALEFKEVKDNQYDRNRFVYRDQQGNDHTFVSNPYQNAINEDKADFGTYLYHRLGGELLHIERAKFSSKTSVSPKPLLDYIKNTVTSFVKNNIDVFFASKAAGKDKLDLFMQHLKEPGACMEDKAKNLIEFKQQNLEGGIQDESVAYEVEHAANTGPDQPLDKMLFAKIESAMKNHPDAESWEELAPFIKEELVGEVRPITEAVVNDEGRVEYHPVMQNGNQVVRAITAEDVERNGRIIFDNI